MVMPVRRKTDPSLKPEPEGSLVRIRQSKSLFFIILVIMSVDAPGSASAQVQSRDIYFNTTKKRTMEKH